MTEPRDLDPSRDYPPSRPTIRLALVALAVIAVAAALLNWAQVSAFAHISQIQSALAHIVGQ